MGTRTPLLALSLVALLPAGALAAELHRGRELQGLPPRGVRGLEGLPALALVRLALAQAAEGRALPFLPLPRGGQGLRRRRLRDLPRRRPVLRAPLRDEGLRALPRGGPVRPVREAVPEVPRRERALARRRSSSPRSSSSSTTGRPSARHASRRPPRSRRPTSRPSPRRSPRSDRARASGPGGSGRRDAIEATWGFFVSLELTLVPPRRPGGGERPGHLRQPLAGAGRAAARAVGARARCSLWCAPSSSTTSSTPGGSRCCCGPWGSTWWPAPWSGCPRSGGWPSGPSGG